MDNKLINVLDHGMVRLVDSMGNDLSVVRSARMSYNASWRTGENGKSDSRLLEYLYKNKHSTPFESVTLTFEVKAPIFVVRQWHRHRTQSYNEASARYTVLPKVFYIPDKKDITTQSKDNKQMRTDIECEESELISDMIRLSCERAFDTYDFLLSKGCPRELARGVLPLNTYTHMSATMNLHNLFRFLYERLHPHAQMEIRVYAQAMLELAELVAPRCVQIFKENM